MKANICFILICACFGWFAGMIICLESPEIILFNIVLPLVGINLLVKIGGFFK